MSFQTFLILEITDPEVNAFLWNVRRILTGRAGRAPIHLTLRGPYEGERPKAVMEQVRDALRHDVLRIGGHGGVGRFSNPAEEVVFFRVDSPNLRSTWWKRDYPVEKFGFEPHISLYRGADATLADRVEMFFKDEAVQLFCAEYRLVWHDVGQPSLLSPPEPTIGAMVEMHESSRVDASVLDRLQELRDKHRFGVAKLG